MKEGDFDRAWFRISNEETNQTLDYSLVEKIEKPEGYEPTYQAEEEEGEPRQNPLTYLHGRLYFTEEKTWVFESFKLSFQKKEYPDIISTLI